MSSTVKKVLIITYYWPPSGGASVQRWLKLTKYLPEYGIEPIVLTVDENSATYPVLDSSFEKEIDSRTRVYKTKSFEILKLFSLLVGKKKVPYGGFSNVNTKSISSKIFRFIRGNLFIPDARVGWNRYAYKKAVEIIDKYNIDTVITTSPPHSSQLIGLKLKRRHKIKWIIDINDPWTDIYYYETLFHLNCIKKIDLKYERESINTSDRIIVNCQSNQELYQSKLRTNDKDKFIIVPNGFDSADFENINKVTTEEFIFTYTGTITELYEPDLFFKLVRKLITRYQDISFKLLFVGTVSPTIKEDVEKYGLVNVTQYLGVLPHRQAIEYAVNSTVLLNIFPKTTHDKGVPGKLGEYLATKNPIISIGPTDGDSALIIEETLSGKSFSRDMEDELMAYLIELVEQWKEDSRSLQNNSDKIYPYSRKYGAEQIANLIKK